jgi:polysaccharide deacetylase family protein (PEP-CTERM system associated)
MTVPLSRTPNSPALKFFECYGYMVHRALGKLVSAWTGHVSNPGWSPDCAWTGVVRAYMPMGANMADPLVSGGAATAVERLGAPVEFSDALSVDVEDYFHVEAFADRVSPSEWAGFPSRVRSNCERILKLFDEHRCRATFFVLGWVAEREPGLVRDIARAGHELACHSYAHRRVFSLRPEQFREDVRRARGLIEEAAGVKVVGYRAPTFSIGRDSLWALDVLAEEGFLYDSSIFPIRHDLYGFPEFPRFAQRLALASGRELFEVPMSTVRVAGWNLPFGSGGYLRLLPMGYTRWAMRRLRRGERQPVVIYFHPWELDPGQPRLEGRWKSRFRHYTGLRSMERRLAEVLSSGRFEPLLNMVNRLRSGHPPLPALVP